MLCSILEIYGNLEGESWEFVVPMIAGAAACATGAAFALREEASTRLLVGTFLAVALVATVIFVMMLLIM